MIREDRSAPCHLLSICSGPNLKPTHRMHQLLSLHQPQEAGALLTPIWKQRKWMPRGVKLLAQNQTELVVGGTQT